MGGVGRAAANWLFVRRGAESVDFVRGGVGRCLQVAQVQGKDFHVIVDDLKVVFSVGWGQFGVDNLRIGVQDSGYAR